MTIELLFLSMVTSAIHRVADNERRRPGRQLGDFRLVERDRDQVRLGPGRRRAEGENECGSEPQARRHEKPSLVRR
jgi:hypothetical protein